MGCSGRRPYEHIKPEQKWDFISLNDFRSTSCWAPLAYGYLWASLIVSVAVYGVDTFTAVQLLAFNNWTSEVTPAIPIEISRWIFSICIILSWINLGYEYWRAIRVMKREAVAESYLDSLAVRIQCIRMGQNGRGFRRFLVFAELTKSKKGAEYVALFTYFSFQSWIRVIFCSGPRQVVNALTLWAVFQAKLDPKAADAGTSILQFFKNIGILADAHHQQAVILSGMLFTLVIWVFAALSLLLALLFYLLFLWHYIPNSDGGLSGYCERKINSRLTKIVSAKVNKALADEERKKMKLAQKSAKKGEAPTFGRQATLPTLFDPKNEDKLPDMPMLHRNDTMTTLPAYTSRPGSPSSQYPTVPGFELSALDQKRPFPSRTETASSAVSNTSFASNAPLMGAAADMGYGRSGSPAPTLPPLDTNGFPFPQRSMTANSNGSQWQRGTPPPRNGAPYPSDPMGPPSRQATQDMYSPDTGGPPSRYMSPDSYSDPRGPPSRQMTQDSYSPNPRGPPSRQMTQNSYSPDSRGYPTRQMTQGSYAPESRGPPNRQMTQDGYATSPISYNDTGRDSPRPQPNSADQYGRPLPRAVNELSGRTTPGSASVGRRTPFTETGSGGRSSPAPSSDMGRSSPAPSTQIGSAISTDPEHDSLVSGNSRQPPVNTNNTSSRSGSGGYNPYIPPVRSASAGIPNPAPTFQSQQQRPYRNMTTPLPAPSRQPTLDYFDNPQPPRQGTPQSQRGGYNDQYNAYPGAGNDTRVASPASFTGRPGPSPQQQGYRR